MTASQKSGIVHEAEAQRQHVRLPLPVRAEINQKSYQTKDLSSGGVSVRDIEGVFVPGKSMTLALVFPFTGFTMDVNLEAEIQHYNKDEKLLGCRFINLSTEQISLLNHVLKSYMAGDVVAAGDLINVAGRNNFMKARNAPAGILAAAPETKKQIAGLALVALLGIIAATVIVSNVYKGLFTIKSQDAYVSGPVVDISAPVAGTYTTELPADAVTVQPGQLIATITPDATFNEGPQVASKIISPCDCYISEIRKVSGEATTSGEKIATLVPVNATPWIVAEVDPEQVVRIGLNTSASVLVAGNKMEYPARVVAIKTGMNSEAGAEARAATAEGAIVARPAQVKIIPEQKLPVDLVGRPARATFSVH